MGATGESVRRLTDFGFNPAWSPDGRRIAFATEGAFDPASRYSQSRLYTLDLATGDEAPGWPIRGSFASLRIQSPGATSLSMSRPSASRYAPAIGPR